MTDKELMHFGIKGMRWGHRSSTNMDHLIRKVGLKKQEFKDHDESIRKQYANHERVVKLTKINGVRTKQNFDGTRSVIKGNPGSAENIVKATRDHIKKIDDNYNKIQANTSLVEKLLFNDKTRQNAAKYMADNNMSMRQARKKANIEAVRNTTMLLGVVGATIVAIALKKI